MLDVQGAILYESNMRLRLQKYSYRFAEQVLNSHLAIKSELVSLALKVLT